MMWQALWDDTLAALGSCLVALLWQGMLLVALAAMLVHATAGSSPRLRHRVVLGSELLLAALAALNLGWYVAPAIGWTATATTGATSRVEALLPVFEVLPAGLHLPAVAASLTHMAPWLGVLWLLGASLFLARVVAGLLRLASMRRSAVPVPAMSRRARGVPVALSAQVSSPLAFGVFRPMILLPPHALQQLTVPELETILAHERTHVQHRDPVWTLVEQLLRALLFFHPACWWLCRRSRTLREVRCDAVVVHELGGPTLYARALTRLEELRAGVLASTPPLSLAVGAGSGALLDRVRGILGMPCRRPRLAYRLFPAVVALVALAMGRVSELDPQGMDAASNRGSIWAEIQDGHVVRVLPHVRVPLGTSAAPREHQGLLMMAVRGSVLVDGEVVDGGTAVHAGQHVTVLSPTRGALELRLRRNTPATAPSLEVRLDGVLTRLPGDPSNAPRAFADTPRR
ncbi:MAG: M56 family metallopeptidase [Planctomycetota bacterium]|jgi:beta-lactamase regulating signal transducer with metallopeptidase domain